MKTIGKSSFVVSPSTRRAWIEIPSRTTCCDHAEMSPSTRRAWIEMSYPRNTRRRRCGSPSTRRAWIEIPIRCWTIKSTSVALYPEGVDRNNRLVVNRFIKRKSPSTRRAWIEMRLKSSFSATAGVALHPEGVDRNQFVQYHVVNTFSRPPPGGRG